MAQMPRDKILKGGQKAAVSAREDLESPCRASCLLPFRTSADATPLKKLILVLAVLLLQQWLN